MAKGLGETIRQARLDLTIGLATLGRSVNTSGQWLSQIERGERRASLELVGRLHAGIKLEAARQGREFDTSLASWLVKWLEDAAFDIGDRAAEPDEVAFLAGTKQAMFDAIATLGRAVPTRSPGTPQLLTNFPEAFSPLAIVLGDRRESAPQTIGDILVYSVSMTDVMFLPKLGLDRNVSVYSDKLFVRMDRKWLEDRFGRTNLLVVGSPGVNLAARVINNHAIFRFLLDDQLKLWDQKLNQLKRQVSSRHKLEVLWRLVQDNSWRKDRVTGDEDRRKEIAQGIAGEEQLPEADIHDLMSRVEEMVGDRTHKEIMNDFKRSGFLDPIDMRIHGYVADDSLDFGVVSVARNPYAKTDDHVAILVGGSHGPGTAHALRALGSPEQFADHPFGGVMEVILDDAVDWPSKFEQAWWEWQTMPYTTEQLEERLVRLRNSRTRSTKAWNDLAAHFSDEDIQTCLDLVRSIAGKAANSRAL